MRQHVIPEWFLKRFARNTPGGLVLSALDKGNGTCRDSIPPSMFMVEVDDHSDEIEAELGRIENAAANAARRLDERAATLPPGIARIANADDPLEDDITSGIGDGGVVEGMRLIVVDRQIAALPDAERQALASFMVLMYSRAPLVQRSMRERIGAYLAGLHAGAAAYEATIDVNALPNIRAEFERARWLGMREAARFGAALAGSNWWLLKAGEGEQFVLGDATVVATLQIGHDDEWRRLIDPASYAVLMPLSPNLALIVGHMVPIGVEAGELVGAINFGFYKTADRFVMAPREEILSELHTSYLASGREPFSEVPVDADAIGARGEATVHRIVIGRTDTLAAPRYLLEASRDVLRRGAGSPTIEEPERGFDVLGDRSRPVRTRPRRPVGG